MGRVTVAGGRVGMKKPVTGILASELSVGSVVKLMEGGSPVEYLVVQQGKPSAAYSESCDGTWLLRKQVTGTGVPFDSDAYLKKFVGSNVYNWIHDTYVNTLADEALGAIKNVTIPCNTGGATSCTAFLLSTYELGFIKTSNNYLPEEGAKLEYFRDAPEGSSGAPMPAYARRIAYDGAGTAYRWWTRTFCTDSTYGAVGVGTDGSGSIGSNKQTIWSVRPAVVVDFETVFNANTLVLEGVG